MKSSPTNALQVECVEPPLLLRRQLLSDRVILNLNIAKKSPGANSKFNSVVDKNWPDWLQIYTDASKISETDHVGSAVWIPKYRIILNYKCPPKSSIFTDSLSCLQDIIKPPFHAKDNFYLTLKIKEVLFKCQQSGIDVILAWIPSHSGILGNETADLCAKEAIHIGREACTTTLKYPPINLFKTD